MYCPVNHFFILNNKIHTTSSYTCVRIPSKNHVYEVFRVINSVPLFLEDHLERLKNSLKAHNFDIDVVEIKSNIKQLLRLNNFVEGNIRINFWQNNNLTESCYFYDKHSYPTSYMYENGVHLGILNNERVNPNIKFFDTLMRNEAKISIEKNNFYEVILVNQNNLVTECSRSNIFFISENRILTPPSEQVLEGVTRKKIIEIIKQQNFGFEETNVFYNELQNFDACFISGTSKRVLAVEKIGGISKMFNVKHQLIKYLHEQFLQLCNIYIQKNQKLENLL